MEELSDDEPVQFVNWSIKVNQPLPSSAPPFLGIMSRQFRSDGDAKGVAGRYGVDKLADPGVCGSLRLPLRLSLSDGVVAGSAKIN